MTGFRVDVEQDGPIAWVVFERPGVLNALAPADLPLLAGALRDAGGCAGVRVVVVRGAGGAFSAGDDLRATADLERDAWRTVVEGFHELTRVALALEVPVVCAIDGVCVGGAFEFACSCDLRVASTRSRLGCPEVGIGLVVSNAATVLLARLCGAGYASELVLTGRLIGAQEALEHGLVNAVVEPEQVEERARVLAQEIAARAPLAVQATKRLLVEGLGEAVEAAMGRETEALVNLVPTADMREGFAAFREKRPASFSGS
ncbi:MAG TPA: enoyl-CoA hydratase/isomerase family protein [Gaiellaceae bacterium]|nr:enoyl-CoA hydratase/isomerase family protein [Gaiellaceae bacterium]